MRLGDQMLSVYVGRESLPNSCRAAICWWIVNRFKSHSAIGPDSTIRHGEFHQRRIDRAHARFLSALKTLATVRKLALPALQVNIGVNQFNRVRANEGEES